MKRGLSRQSCIYPSLLVVLLMGPLTLGAAQQAEGQVPTLTTTAEDNTTQEPSEERDESPTSEIAVCDLGEGWFGIGGGMYQLEEETTDLGQIQQDWVPGIVLECGHLSPLGAHATWGGSLRLSIFQDYQGDIHREYDVNEETLAFDWQSKLRIHELTATAHVGPRSTNASHLYPYLHFGLGGYKVEATFKSGVVQEDDETGQEFLETRKETKDRTDFEVLGGVGLMFFIHGGNSTIIDLRGTVTQPYGYLQESRFNVTLAALF